MKNDTRKAHFTNCLVPKVIISSFEFLDFQNLRPGDPLTFACNYLGQTEKSSEYHTHNSQTFFRSRQLEGNHRFEHNLVVKSQFTRCLST